MKNKIKKGELPEDFQKATAERLLRAIFQQAFVDEYPGKQWSTTHTFKTAMKQGAFPECKKAAIVAIRELLAPNDYWDGVIKQIEKFK